MKRRCLQVRVDPFEQAGEEHGDALVAAKVNQPLGDGAGREAAAADARLRLRHQIPDAEKAARADYVLENTGDRDSLHAQVVALWQRLQEESKEESNIFFRGESLK